VFRDDSLYERVREVKRLKETTDAEHLLLKTALLDASARFQEAARTTKPLIPVIPKTVKPQATRETVETTA